LKRHCIKVSIL